MSSKNIGLGLVAVALLLSGIGWGQAAMAQGDPPAPRVSWTPTDRCPRPPDLLRRIAGLIGVSEARLRGRLRALDAVVAPDPGRGLRLQLSLQTASGSGERSFSAASCAALVDGAVMIAAIAIDPDVALREPQGRRGARAPSPPQPRAVQLALRPSAHVLVGVLPDAGVGFGLAGGLLWRRLRVELDLAHGLPVRGLSGAAGSAGGDLRLPLLGELRACYRRRLGTGGLLGRLELDACLGSAIGWIYGEGVNVDQPGSGGTSWWGVLAAAALSLKITDVWWVRLEGRGGVGLARASFEIAGIGRIHRASAGVGRFGGGIEARIF